MTYPMHHSNEKQPELSRVEKFKNSIKGWLIEVDDRISKRVVDESYEAGHEPVSEYSIRDRFIKAGTFIMDTFERTIGEHHQAAIHNRGIQEETLTLINSAKQDDESGEL